ncbi:uncharacterized protein LOC142804047 isoform X3 [Rhipicephalus microplus]|uniref:uncharacterized protein LOC142804047 isoform X3 n=1 Tax=Rhipicephalus microplus TaxID=6941 RepID=UPI003F6BE6E6
MCVAFSKAASDAAQCRPALPLAAPAALQKATSFLWFHEGKIMRSGERYGCIASAGKTSIVTEGGFASCLLGPARNVHKDDPSTSGRLIFCRIG